ncbi:hypothetical protein B0A49_10599 [Cryomyces minteri]|uniref:Peroxidase n=2 Tax=Cryomyces minteri TaxID=331657 RepID=A0A4U0W0K1_9PEZI|nr:hypothetical protein B0A49_10599 [Cryomyces minteri]
MPSSIASYFTQALGLLSLASALALPVPVNDGSPTRVLIGDLKTKITSPIGQSIANQLLGLETSQSSVVGTPPSNGQGLGACKKSTDPCCIYYSLSKDLSSDFTGPTGRCNDLARAAIRLGFHDAGTWSQSLAASGQDFGGADGSLVLFGEISRGENRGLEGIVAAAKKYQNKYGVGMADLIQYMATHAVDATQAAPNGLLPPVTGDPDSLIALFADKTIPAHDLAALLGAHSTSKQFHVDSSQSGAPQDSTPGVWDVSFYNETIQNPAPKGVFRFASDLVLAKDPRVSSEWNSFINDQHHWNEDYATAYVRLSLLGVNNINNLTECSATLPVARPTFPGSSEGGFDG